MSPAQMRAILAKKYSPKFVAGKSDKQIHTIYMRLLDKGQLKGL